MKFKALLHELLPPFVYRLAATKHESVQTESGWRGVYESWGAAIAGSKGYDNDKILAAVLHSMLKVKNGEAAYERDSVTFDRIQYAWPLLVFLLKAALENNGMLKVIDFGGGLGSTFFQNKEMLNLGERLEWNIVEQENFVTCGKTHFEDSTLRFHNDVKSCLDNQPPSILILSGVIQYLEDPHAWTKYFNDLKIGYIIVDRTAFVDSGPDMIVVQQSSELADYPAWFLNKKQFITDFDRYEIISEFPDHTTPPIIMDHKTCYWGGIAMRLINN